MSIEFLLTSLIVVGSPGTGAIYTLAVGLSRGGQASVIAAFGCTLGIVPHLLAAMLGLAAILHASAVVFEAFKFAGVAYLLYMAWQVWRADGALGVDAGPAARSPVRIVLQAVLINILNPKLSIFFLAFLPQFISPTVEAPMARMIEMSGIFMAMTFAVFSIYGLFAAVLRDRVVTRPRVMAWMRRTFAAAFVALGARLVLAER
ncbi:MAG: LysE family translocator [Rhizobiaceae bacterium]|nr:LysE family translocator [Rhizobiaceae bacterium]